MRTKRIKAVKFGLLSPKEVRKMSSSKIITADTYGEDGFPIEMGLVNQRLGVIDPGLKCKTCGGKMGECPGHFGHIELAAPVIHIGYAKLIFRMLSATCRKCGKVLLGEKERKRVLDEIELQRERQADVDVVVKQVFKEAAKTSVCPFCGEPKMVVKLEKPCTYIEIDEEERKRRLMPTDVRERLEKIPDDDLPLFGIDARSARPEWAVLKVLPVPPVTARPTITLESGQRSEDDLTHKLVDIIRINQRFAQNRDAGAPQLIIEDLWELLQYHVSTYYNNEIAGLPPARHRSGRPLKTMEQRLKGKEGRFRGSLSGKRVNFSARTVISPDPDIEIDEVGVPEAIARELTITVTVTDRNLEAMKETVKRGNKHPGANYVRRADGKKVKVTESNYESLADELGVGWRVERHLQDGDIVLFNRQPSLHRVSIMAHRVRVMPGKTFRLSPVVCVAGDTPVLLDGGVAKIEDLKRLWEGGGRGRGEGEEGEEGEGGGGRDLRVLTCDWATRELVPSRIKAFHCINPAEFGLKCYKLKTEKGRELRVTEDHPFYTARGVLPARELREGDKVASYPVEFPSLEVEGVEDLEGLEPRVLLTEEEVRGFVPENADAEYVVATLKNKGLLPLRVGSKTKPNSNLSSNSKLKILARLVGHIFGDGTLGLVKVAKDRRNFKIYFRGEISDLKRIKEDLALLGFESGERKIVNGVSNWFKLGSQPLGVLLAALGVPVGDRTVKEVRVPEWLFEVPLAVKRAFLAAYLGSELSSPLTGTRSKKRFRVPVFKITKAERLVENGFALADDFARLLKDFGVAVSSTKLESGNIRKDGTVTKTVVVELSSGLESLQNLYGKVGFEYAAAKEKRARHAYFYLSEKLRAVKERARKLEVAKALREEGATPKEIAERVGIPEGTLSGWLHRGFPKQPTAPNNFPEFKEFTNTATAGLSKSGIVWDKIEVVEECYLETAYDLTTESENHNFFASNLLTGNCPPYNADFDGDEMNVHVLQTEEARAEAKILMAVQHNIISPRFGKPIIGGIHDYITGLFLLTYGEKKFTREEALGILEKIEIDDLGEPAGVEAGAEVGAGAGASVEGGTEGSVKGSAEGSAASYWTGKQIFSRILPKGLNLQFRGMMCEKCFEKGGRAGWRRACERENCTREGYIKIKDGELVSGVIDEVAVGSFKGRIIDRIFRQFGEDATKKFIKNNSRLATNFILRTGFSFGISEEDIPAEGQWQIKEEAVRAAERKVDELIKAYEEGELEALPGRSLEETLELLIMQELGRARDDAGGIAGRYLGIENAGVLMAKSGARGSMLNLTQMAACVGQQSVRGERIRRGYQDRTLPHFKPGDRSAKARGFVRSSFKDGLSPTEYFFHAVGGREALVDTAVRTSQSGYFQRRLINALLDLEVKEDGTVRETRDTVVQFKYGEDGADPSKGEYGKVVDLDEIIKEEVKEKEEMPREKEREKERKREREKERKREREKEKKRERE